MIVVRPGERIAADGQVISGASEVDQATITGEPLPAPKEAGDAVFAGTLNGTGVLTIRAGTAAADFVIARIVTMVAEASATKARTQLFIEKVERRYSVGMVAATVALFAIPLLAGEAFQAALLRAMTFMIVASPCAVVLATMPPLLAAMANSGRTSPGEIGRRDGGGGPDRSCRLRQDRHADRLTPEAGRGPRAARRRAHRTRCAVSGRRRGEPVRAPACPRRGERGKGRRADGRGGHPFRRAARTRRDSHGRRPDGRDRQPKAPTGNGSSRRISKRVPPELHEAEPAALEEDGQTVAVMRVDGTPAAVLGIVVGSGPAPRRRSRRSARSPARPRCC